MEKQGRKFRVLSSGTKEFEAWKAHHRKYGFDFMPIQDEAKKIWQILTPYHKGRPLPEIRIRFASSAVFFEDGGVSIGTGGSYAHTTRGFISLRGPVDWMTLLHELCHMAVGHRAGHGERFYKAMRFVIEKRWKITMSVHDAPAKFGYAWDRHFSRQVAKAEVLTEAWPKVEFVFEAKRKTKAPVERKERKEHPITAAFVEGWMRKNVGEIVSIVEVCEKTGAAHMTVRKAGKRWLHPTGERGRYRIEAAA